MRSSEVAEHFVVTVNQLQKKTSKMTRACGDGHNYCMFFCCQRNTCFARALLPTTHEVGTASAAQVDRSHDVSPLLGAEVSEAHPKRVRQEGGLALRTNPSGTRPATVRIRLGSPSPRRTTKNDSMNVGGVALLDVRTRDLASSELISLEDGRGFCQACGKVSNTREPL